MRRFIFRVLKNEKKEKTNDRFPILINARNSRYNYQTNRLSFFLPPPRTWRHFYSIWPSMLVTITISSNFRTNNSNKRFGKLSHVKSFHYKLQRNISRTKEIVWKIFMETRAKKI